MNILQLISSTGFFGAENAVMQLSRTLSTLGHTVSVGVITAAGRKPAWPAERIGHSAPVCFPSRGRFDLATIRAIRRFVLENKVWVVNSHNYKSDFFGYWACRGTGIRMVATCHNWLAHNCAMRLYERIDKRLLRRFNTVIAVSAQLRGEIIASGIEERNVITIANGITGIIPSPANVSRVRERAGIARGEKVIVSVGRLSPEKGHIVLLQAFSSVFRSLPFARLLLVGDGPERARLESEARQLGLKHAVVFTGFRSDIPDVLGAADVFALPSMTEGMPLALLEAMACGRPCVATRVGAVPELLGRDEYGLLVAPGDPHPLAQALLRLLNDPCLAAALAHRGRIKVREDFSAEKMAEHYVRVYRNG